MMLSEDIVSTIQRYTRLSCSNKYCQENITGIRNNLLKLLQHNDIVDFRYVGEERLHPTSIHIRPVYAIVHSSGKYKEISFTGMSTIQVFANNARTRSTHCRNNEFLDRMNKFLETSKEGRDDYTKP